MSLPLSPATKADTAARRRNPVIWATQLAAVVVVCGFGTALYLSRQFPDAPQAMRTARLALSDPETTGSIDVEARTTRLDPCTISSGHSFR